MKYEIGYSISRWEKFLRRNQQFIVLCSFAIVEWRSPGNDK